MATISKAVIVNPIRLDVTAGGPYVDKKSRFSRGFHPRTPVRGEGRPKMSAVCFVNRPSLGERLRRSPFILVPGPS